MNRFLFSLFLACGLLLGAPRHAAAVPHYFLGIELPYTTMGGDFHDGSALAGSRDIILIPETDGAVGIGIVGGYAVSPRWSCALSYETSKHSGSWAGYRVDVLRNSLLFGVKRNFRPYDSTRPYIMAGFGLQMLIIRHGAIDLLTGAVENGQLSGSAFAFGAGVDHYLTRSTSLGLGLAYRLVSYNHARGISGSGGIEDPVWGNEISIRLGATYHF